MSLFPRYFANELAPATNVFRLLDEYANQVMDTRSQYGSQISKTFRTFSPKFDVKETKETYELHGELPGIEQKNVSIEFTDAQTLTIKGRTEHHREEGERPAGLIEGEVEQGQITDGSNHYHKPSVEEEDQAQMSGANPDAPKQSDIGQTQVQKSEQKQRQQSRYWVSERSVGEFARSFNFPSRVDQDAVKASLKDGILSVVVPKAQAPKSKRINIE